MIHHIHRPSFPLNRHIAVFTYFKGLVPGHGFERFLPDGNVEIIVDLAGRAEHIYDDTALQPIQTCREIWASGVRTRYLTLSSGHKSELFVINFRKGMAYPFFPVPMQEMSDRVVDADSLWRGGLSGLRERLLEAPTPTAKFHVAEGFLSSMRRGPLEANACVEHAIQALLDSPENMVLERLYSNIGYSKKHFIRLFSERVGVPPKTYARLARFQKVVQEIARSGGVDWSSVARECGFYDQAHFIHDFKRFSGFTPSEYSKRKSDDVNYVPLG